MADYKEASQEWLDKMAAFPLLSRLHRERVLSIGECLDGTFNIKEECDQHFQEALTKDQMRELAAEVLRFIEL